MDRIVAYCTIEAQEVPYNRLIQFGLEPVNIIVWTSIPYNGPVVMSVIIFRVRATSIHLRLYCTAGARL